MTHFHDPPKASAQPPPGSGHLPARTGTRRGMGGAAPEDARALALARKTPPSSAGAATPQPILASPSLRFRLLGTPEVQVAQRLQVLQHQKAQALLFYLAVTGRPQTRDHLATLLWSESPDSNARHSLRSSLYQLRRVLQSWGVAERLEVQRNLVWLRLEEDECDVTCFHSLAAASQEHALQAAVALYSGPLLEGLCLGDAPVFEEWHRAERARCSHAHLNALNSLAAWAETRQAWGEAIEYVQRMLQMDALAEEAQRRLIQLYLRSGASGRALRQYHQFETELQRELGLSPSPETQELLYHALHPQRPPALPTEPALTPAAATTPREERPGEHLMPFVGREDLLNQFMELLREPLASRGITVLLQGEDGMGKSRLLDEMTRTLAALSPPWTILRGSCSPFDDLLSYGPFFEALQSAASGDVGELLVASGGNGGNGGNGGHAREVSGTILWRVLQLLRALTQTGPLLLALDDLQWANSATLHLFGFLATRIRNLPVMLVGTMQYAEAMPAVQRLLSLGRPHGGVHLFSVTPLALEAVAALLRTLGLSTDAAVTLAHWLQE